MSSMRIRVRQARKVQEAWRKGTRQRDGMLSACQSIGYVWRRLQTLQRQLELATERGFVHASRCLREEIGWKLDELSRYLPAARSEASRLRTEPTLADWFCELQSLDEEFGNLHVNPKLGIVRVTTEPITLKEVELGPFRIELHLSRLEHQRGSSCFDILAMEPNPASGRDEVIHPHVNDGDLCAGDAAKPIELALAEGRISEAFLMIHAVLRTYNPKSAYVSLDEWDGTACGDCGGRVRRDDSSYCEGCHSDLCDGCASSCRSCEDTRCAGCLTACDGCEDLCCLRCLERIKDGTSLCSSCRGICSGCNAVFLNSELDDNGDCPACAEAVEPEPTQTLEDAYAS